MKVHHRFVCLSMLILATVAQAAEPIVTKTPHTLAAAKVIVDDLQQNQVFYQEQSGPYRIAIACDPSGNAVEILAREPGPAIGAAKLIVADRKAAEEFYVQVFGAKPLQYFNTSTYDEVLLGFNDGMLALFQPKDEAPLRKSQFPVVTFRTSAIDLTSPHLKQAESKSPEGERVFIAKDPSDNRFEVIAR